MFIFTLLADWLTYGIFNLVPESHFASSLHFFIEDVSKITVLLLVMIYLIALLRAGVDTDLIRRYLQGKARGVGYLLAALFGAVTPFCSCSSIPLFLGFTSARIPLGITMAFLITSPIINEVAVVLLGSILGIRFMVFYLITGLAAGILGGFIIDLLKAERYLTPIGHKAMEMASSGEDSPGMEKTSGPGCSCGGEGGCGTAATAAPARRISLQDRHAFAKGEVQEIFRRVWKWVLMGVGLGAALHGFVPESFITDTLGDGQWWSVPAAVLLGIPLYANAGGIIPVAESLLAKGLPVGTTLAFMMSVVAASFPEFMMLKQVMKPRLLGIFFLMLLCFFTLIGWVFNIIY